MPAGPPIRKLFAAGYSACLLSALKMIARSQETADKLVEAAHRVCPYSNATRGNIEVTLVA